MDTINLYFGHFKFTPFHAEPIKAQLENLPTEVIELIKEHTLQV
jgi:hypothetical protein